MPARPLDILVVATRFPLASETFVRQQCLDLVRAGHRVEILSLRAGDGAWIASEREAGLPALVRCAGLDAGALARIARLPVNLARLAARSPTAACFSLRVRGVRADELLAIARALGGPRRFDAIHCHFGPAGLVACAARRAGIITGRLGVGFYGYDLTREPLRAGKRVYAPLFEDGALLLPHSRYLADRLVALGAPQQQVQLHRLGIDIPRFEVADRPSHGGPLRLLSIGRFVEKKGFAFALRALAATGSPATLRLIGDGPLRGELESLARELGLQQRVEFAGWLPFDAIAAELARADALLAPSVTASDGDMEGLPLVVIEAMATGLPVIGSAHSGIPEVVVDGVTGFVVPERDAVGLAAAIDRLAPEALRKELGAAARARVCEEFDGRSLAERLCARYRGG